MGQNYQEQDAAAARVLLVEDEFAIRVMLAEALSEHGFDVTDAPCADDAVALLGDGFALLLTDVQMPGALDGIALAALAREKAPGLPGVVMAGAVRGQRDAMLSKPFTAGDACAAAERMIARFSPPPAAAPQSPHR